MSFIGCDMYVHVYVILKASVVLMLGFTDFASDLLYIYIHVHFEAHTDPCSMSIASIVDDDNV